MQQEYSNVFTIAALTFIMVEEFVTNPYNHVSTMMIEAEVLWNSDFKQWKQEPLLDPTWSFDIVLCGVSIHLRTLGHFQSRASATTNASAELLLKFLTSPQGYQVNDLLSNPAIFDLYLERCPLGTRKTRSGRITFLLELLRSTQCR
ncbi:hypothetical protein EON65_35055 [archaeon]|nr:MAG: hypothetical protein EON65_35055 [archaeon]